MKKEFITKKSALRSLFVKILKENLDELDETPVDSSSSEEEYREQLKGELKPFDASKTKEMKKKEKLLKDKKKSEADEADDEIPSQPAFNPDASKGKSKDDTKASKSDNTPSPEKQNNQPKAAPTTQAPPAPDEQGNSEPQEPQATATPATPATPATAPQAEKKPDYGNNKPGVSAIVNKPMPTDDPNEVSVDVLVDLINRIKAGRSAKDTSSRDALNAWLDSFLGPEKLALRKFLEGLVGILVKNEPGNQASKPSDPPVSIKMTSPLAGATAKSPDSKDAPSQEVEPDGTEPQGVAPKTLDARRRENNFFSKDATSAEAPIKVQRASTNRI